MNGGPDEATCAELKLQWASRGPTARLARLLFNLAISWMGKRFRWGQPGLLGCFSQCGHRCWLHYYYYCCCRRRKASLAHNRQRHRASVCRFRLAAKLEWTQRIGVSRRNWRTRALGAYSSLFKLLHWLAGQCCWTARFASCPSRGAHMGNARTRAELAQMGLSPWMQLAAARGWQVRGLIGADGPDRYAASDSARRASIIEYEFQIKRRRRRSGCSKDNNVDAPRRACACVGPWTNCRRARRTRPAEATREHLHCKLGASSWWRGGSPCPKSPASFKESARRSEVGNLAAAAASILLPLLFRLHVRGGRRCREFREIIYKIFTFRLIPASNKLGQIKMSAKLGAPVDVGGQVVAGRLAECCSPLIKVQYCIRVYGRLRIGRACVSLARFRPRACASKFWWRIARAKIRY